MPTRKGIIETQAKVTEALSRGDFQFQVELKDGHKVLVYLAGKMKRDVKGINKISVGDEVIIELSLHDLDRGRITGKNNAKK